MPVSQNPKEQVVQVCFQAFFHTCPQVQCTRVQAHACSHWSVWMSVNWVCQYWHESGSTLNLRLPAATDIQLSPSDLPAIWLLFLSHQMSSWQTACALCLTTGWLLELSKLAPQQKSSSSSMMVKYPNWKLIREAESFQTAAAACGRSSRSLMSTRGKHWLTETRSHPHVHDRARNVQLGSCTCFKLLREESQADVEVANRSQQVVSGTFPPLLYDHCFSAYLKLNLQNHNLWRQMSNVLTFWRRARHQLRSAVQPTPSLLRRWTCVTTGGSMLPGVLSGWEPVPNVLETVGTTKREFLPPSPSVVAGMLAGLVFWQLEQN